MTIIISVYTKLVKRGGGYAFYQHIFSTYHVEGCITRLSQLLWKVCSYRFVSEPYIPLLEHLHNSKIKTRGKGFFNESKHLLQL